MPTAVAAAVEVEGLAGAALALPDGQVVGALTWRSAAPVWRLTRFGHKEGMEGRGGEAKGGRSFPPPPPASPIPPFVLEGDQGPG